MSSSSRLWVAALAVAAVLAPSARAQQLTGKKYALLVGVKDYDHSSLSSLKYTESDVREFAAVLRGKEAGFHEVVVLTTGAGEKEEALKPTAKNIREQLRELSDKVKRHDLLIVGLAGHGLQFTVVDPRTKRDRYESFFCPADARPKSGQSLEELSKSMIPLGELFRELDESGAGVRLLLVDACRNDVSDYGSRSVDPDFLPKPSKGTAALFSCKSGERAFETKKLGKGHGVFFYHVIEALKGEARNGKGEVTWNGLADYVVNAVADKVPVLIGDGAKQTPHEMKNIEGKSPVLLKLEKASAAVAEGEAEKLFREADGLIQGLGATFDEARAFRLFRLAAERGHPLGQAMVGYLTCYGSGTEANREEGERTLKDSLPRIESAADKGDAVAARLLGSMYVHGLGVKRDYREAHRWFRKAADRGDPSGMSGLGVTYDKGQGVEMDHEEAVRWYRKSADKGCASGMFNLGANYSRGAGVEKDEREAARWYRKAAAKGETRAMTNLAFQYTLGQGVAKDEKEAFTWFRKAADHGEPLAMHNLGRIYKTGRGAEKDEKEAVRWFRKAAVRGNELGMYNLGLAYASGEGVKKDEKQAVYWIREAGEHGYPLAMTHMGFLSETGRWVEKDDKEAARWYRKAAEVGHPNGMANLAGMYATGRGVKKDEKEAAKWYRKAADKGYAAAMTSLGYLYANGRGVPRDRAEAIRWYRKAVAAGDKQARKLLDQLEKDG